MPRPEKPIDWTLVDNLLTAECIGTEIASHFDMHPETFYDRVKDKYKVGFTEYASVKRQKGNSLLRAKQFEKAMKGNDKMLLLLGKSRLGQQDKTQISIDTGNLLAFALVQSSDKTKDLVNDEK
jgi:hypothetical protein